MGRLDTGWLKAGLSSKLGVSTCPKEPPPPPSSAVGDRQPRHVPLSRKANAEVSPEEPETNTCWLNEWETTHRYRVF